MLRYGQGRIIIIIIIIMQYVLAIRPSVVLSQAHIGIDS